MDGVTRYPVDFDKLDKGSVVPAEVIEKMANASRGTPRFALTALSLCSQIERELARRGRIVFVRQVKNDVRVLTDPEAAKHAPRRCSSGRKRERKAHAIQLAIDARNLTDDERREHERRVLIESRYMAARNGVSRQIRLEACRRNVPTLPGFAAEAG